MMISITAAEWFASGRERYGDDPMDWKFKCPACGHVATVSDWRAVGASESEVAFSCVGRHIAGAKDAFTDTKSGPCTYAGGGLFKLNPVSVIQEDGTTRPTFDFAERPLIPFTGDE